MDRIHIINAILGKKKRKSYLEIGVKGGACFFKIKADNKTAVDPRFRFNLFDKLKWMLINSSNFKADYYSVTSDDFFKAIPRSISYDVVFIDGLHTHEQSLKDVDNALKHLNDDGVIIMHDCNPPNEAAAYPNATSPVEVAKLNLPGYTNEWTGDVWKTIVHLRATRDDLNVFVLDCDYGVGVISRGKPQERVSLSDEELKNLTYKNLGNREIINLVSTEYLDSFLSIGCN